MTIEEIVNTFIEISSNTVNFDMYLKSIQLYNQQFRLTPWECVEWPSAQLSLKVLLNSSNESKFCVSQREILNNLNHFFNYLLESLYPKDVYFE